MLFYSLLPMHKAIRYAFLLMFMVFTAGRSFASAVPSPSLTVFLAETAVPDTLHLKINTETGTGMLFKKMDEEKRKKLVSALFAFPFPFGFMGAHRVMLGSKPWVPVVYVATLGGCFGLIPLIDFFTIIFTKDLKQYENNPHVFMWLK